MDFRANFDAIFVRRTQLGFRPMCVRIRIYGIGVWTLLRSGMSLMPQRAFLFNAIRRVGADSIFART